MNLTKTKTDVIIDQTIEEIKVHANFLRLYSGPNEILADIPVEQINSIMIFGSNVNIPAILIKICNTNQIPLHILTDYNKHNGSIYFTHQSNILNRQSQFQAILNEDWHLYIAKQILWQKSQTQILAMDYWRSEDMIIENQKNLQSKLPNLKTINSLMGNEGISATYYWQEFGQQIPQEFDWKGRIKNPCLDPVNSLLSLAYSLLSTQCQTSLTINGLDPYFGVLHTPNDDRPALVYDIMEIYRVLLVDLWVLELFATQRFTAKDFRFTAKGICTLESDQKNEFFRLWFKRLKYQKFSTNQGQITISEFLDHNTKLLIQWFDKINNNKQRDTGRYDRLSESLIIFGNIEEFKSI
jgi:CRISP-associated protein Cas1